MYPLLYKLVTHIEIIVFIESSDNSSIHTLTNQRRR